MCFRGEILVCLFVRVPCGVSCLALVGWGFVLGLIVVDWVVLWLERLEVCKRIVTWDLPRDDEAAL